MNDQRNVLKSKFKESHRYNNFGNVLIQIHVQGFRCHANTVIDIKNPITAFCGLNGVGKSTLIQLIAVAYKGKLTQDTYYISKFINIHKFDPKPFRDDAKVSYQYCSADNKSQQTTISRRRNGSWSNYARRPYRKVLYVGVGSYLPKVDTSDFTVRYPQGIQLIESQPINKAMQKWTCKILGKNYDEILAHTFQFRRKRDIINSVKHEAIEYSEPHMGYGEARSQYLVRHIEALPEKSLILLEEPEISLHPSAQYQLGCYLVDVSVRKGHQIFLTTHSESLLSSLSSDSIICLKKTNEGVKTIPGLTASQSYSLMSEGYSKALTILVEDKKDQSVAQCILTEVIRTIDPEFLSFLGIFPVGSCETVKTAIEALKDTNHKFAAVLDADQNPTPDNNIFVLPSHNKKAPEVEIFCESPQVVEYVYKNYEVKLDDFLAAIKGIDHHYWFEKLAQKISIKEIALVSELSKVYVQTLSENERSSLVQQLKEATSPPKPAQKNSSNN
ncbi:AAA family ATPase [Lyngbya sp. CCY1209]|uniref:ATP-dependent nuclease n=1 Tax=Lyngbya sp. CCY1209 TaxID=2886103 RepID=UPI002D216219|nr:AAA family ATPase [Lyngbya sp. CCY1209]MEB3886134.1 AAA family ATPase [Lyngbya sp. CCY1209]